MKKLLLKAFMLLCLVAWGGANSAWAEDVTGTITFGTNNVKIDKASVTGDDDLGNTWTITTEGTTSFTTNAAYYQVGSSNNPATSITFTTTLPSSQTIKSMSAKFGGFSGTAGTVTLKVGDTSVGTGSLNATNDVTVSSTSSATGTVLTVTVTGIAKGVKVYNISYTYNNGGSTPTTYTIAVANNITNGTVTASPTSAVEGTEITLTATPSTGYEFGSWDVTNASTSAAITVTDNKFTMPAADVNVSATFTAKPTRPENEIFYESFDTNDGTGGNDNQWSGSIASNNIKQDNDGWVFENGSGAKECAKFGAGSKLGTATTPALGQACNATLTFKAAAWNGSSESTTLKLSVIGGGSISPATVTMTKGAWDNFEVTLTNLTADSKIKFEGNSTSNSRFFLDEVSIVKTGDISTYTIAWSVNGAIVKTENLKEDEEVTVPSVVAPDGKVFTGWVTAAIDGTTNDKPALVTPSATATATITYYAVFATLEGEGTTETFGWEEATTPTNWTIGGTITRTEGTTNNPANSGSYFGALNSNCSVQFKNKVKVKSFSYYCVRKTSNTNTSIKIETSTNGTSWTEALSTTWNTFNSDGKTYKKIEKTWDTPTECYVRVNIVTAAARMLDDVSITYGDVTYSDYCTTVPAPETSTLDFIGTTGNGEYYATFSSDKNVVIPTEQNNVMYEAYAINVNETGELVYSSFTDDIESKDENGNIVVPANTGVLLYAITENAEDPTLTYSFTETVPESLLESAHNMLYPGVNGMITEPANCKYYMLDYGKHNEETNEWSELGFYYGAPDGAAFQSRLGNAYLAVPTDIANARGFSFDGINSIETIEAIPTATAIYTLNGVKVNEFQKGLNIVNGKKVMIK